MISMMSSFTRPDRHNPALFRLLPNSFRFSYDHHLLQQSMFVFIPNGGGRGGGVLNKVWYGEAEKTEKVYPFCTPIDKWYSFRMPSFELCILLIALLNHNTKENGLRTADAFPVVASLPPKFSKFFCTAIKCIGPKWQISRYPFIYFNQ